MTQPTQHTLNGSSVSERGGYVFFKSMYGTVTLPENPSGDKRYLQYVLDRQATYVWPGPPKDFMSYTDWLKTREDWAQHANI